MNIYQTISMFKVPVIKYHLAQYFVFSGHFVSLVYRMVFRRSFPFAHPLQHLVISTAAHCWIFIKNRGTSAKAVVPRYKYLRIVCSCKMRSPKDFTFKKISKAKISMTMYQLFEIIFIVHI